MHTPTKKATYNQSLKIIFLILLSILNNLYLRAQTPLTPEAGNLYKVLTSEINGSTGQSDVSFPLYNLNIDQVNIPITLKYDSQGIKVENEASNIGTSWSLSMGGIIIRNQSGLPDEYSKTFYTGTTFDSQGNPICTRYLIKENVSYFNFADISNDVANYYLSNNNFNNYTGPLYSSSANNIPDPDIFQYMLPDGRNGSFIIKNLNNVVSSSSDKVLVYLDATGDISNFTIIDTEGNSFFFNDVEKNNNSFIDDLFYGSIAKSTPLLEASTINIKSDVLSFHPCAEGSSNGIYTQPGAIALTNKTANSSWFLSKIISVNGNEINFLYDNERHSKLSNTSLIYDEANLIIYPNGMAGYGNNFINSNKDNQFTTKRLKEIKSSSGSILFQYDANKREDVKNSFNETSPMFNSTNNYSEVRALKHIVINNNQNQLVKKIDFYNTYKNSIGINNATESTFYLYKRLWLDKIVINDLEEYKFDYISGNLPYKFSFEQDYWGFYNNNNADLNKKTLLPDLWYYPQDPRSNSRVTNFSIFKRKTFVGPEYKLSTFPAFSSKISNYLSNRDINESSQQIGMLEKITYPTKGYEKFIYESNDFLLDNELKKGFGLRIKRIETYNNNNLNSATNYKYVNSDGSSSGTITALNIFGKISAQNSQTSTLLYAISTNAYMNDCDLHYKKIEKITPTFGKVVTEYLIPYDINTDTALYLPNSTTPLYSKNYNFAKQRIRCGLVGNCMTVVNNVATFRYIKNSFEHPTREINRNYQNLFGKKKSEFLYDESGNIVKKTENTYILNPFSKKQLSFIGRTNDLTVDNTLGETEMLVKSYSLIDWVLESSKTTDIFNGGTSTSNLIEYNYVSNNIGHHNPVRIKKTSSNGQLLTTFFKYPTDYNFTLKYTIDCVAYRKQCEIDNKYKCGTDQSCYNVWCPCQTENNYNLTGFTQVLKTMIDRNMILPIEIKQTSNNGIEKIVSSSLTEYRYDNSNIVKSKIYNLEKSNTTFQDSFLKDNKPFLDFVKSTDYFEDMIFQNYYANGNVKEITKRNGTHTVFIWGYNQTQVVAKIENATSNEVEPYIANIQNFSNGTDEQLFMSELNKLRDNLPKAMVTTYTHKPLIGVTSITDPKGDKINYFYNNAGQLESIKDAKGNIISENKYYYKN